MAGRDGPAAALVASGIFLSRLAGLVRQRVLAHYLGLGDAADALAASFRIPNLLQNLFGEGVLSASFIPVYAKLVAEGRRQEADRVAGAVGTLLAAAMALLVAAGVALSPAIVALLMPGFEGAKRELTIMLVRIMFPGTGLLVMSAWCLGILNSHGRFFLSYAAPVAWNAAIIASALLAGVGRGPEGIAVWVAWGAAAGGLLQLVVQLPAVPGLGRSLIPSLGRGVAGAGTVVRNFGPAVLGRGANQVSAYVDGMIASLLGTGAQAGLANAQLLYTLPVSLFGMSVSAAELPAMSAVRGPAADRGAAV
ncbi:MAG TPA: lipid II flippase MurJ, partial [Gemmatimonadales bacterium]|nr:lipid II flippase MurJ [Gemmatimonadales bacterium]